jgi:hypothetical protein
MDRAVEVSAVVPTSIDILKEVLDRYRRSLWRQIDHDLAMLRLDQHPDLVRRNRR